MHESDHPELHAWVDESMRQHAVPDPMYLLGAVVSEPARCSGTRHQLRTVLPKGAPKLHWHELSPRKKTEVTAVVASAEGEHLVVVATALNLRKQERARAECLKRLLWELGQRNVSLVHLEARTPSLNKRDMDLILRLRGQRAIPAGIRVEIELPSIEPMLWVPDQVLGAVGDAETGDRRWLDQFQGAVQIIRIVLQ